MDIDLTPGRRPFRILIVSTGDVCRGPAAQRLLADALARRPGTAGAYDIASAGTRAPIGCDLHPLTAQALREHGLDPGRHEAVELTAELVAWADLVLAADRAHRLAAADLDPSAARHTFTIRELARAYARTNRAAYARTNRAAFARTNRAGAGEPLAHDSRRTIALPEPGAPGAQRPAPPDPWDLADALLAAREVWRPAHPVDDDLADPITGGAEAHRSMVDDLAAALEVCAAALSASLRPVASSPVAASPVASSPAASPAATTDVPQTGGLDGTDRRGAGAEG